MAGCGKSPARVWWLFPYRCQPRTAAPIQQVDGLLWEVAPWLPGDPVAERPPAAWQVESAFAALAELHLRLSRHEHQGVSPGLRRRVSELEELSKRGLDLMEAAFQGAPAAELSTMAQRWALLARAVIPRLLPSLRDAARLEVTLQPCLRDARPEHFLFEARRLAGLVDFGAMGIETVAADLARLIGEWFPDDPSLLLAGDCGIPEGASAGGIGDRPVQHARGRWRLADRRTLAALAFP